MWLLNADIFGRKCCETVIANSGKLHSFVVLYCAALQCEKKHEWKRSIAAPTKRDFCDCCRSSRGVTRLDGARGKKQVWHPYVWTWDLSDIVGDLWRPHSDSAPGELCPLSPLVTPLLSRGHFRYGVERAKRFVNVHWHRIVSNMESISKISSLPPWKRFCGRPCFWLEFFQVSGIFLTFFGCFLPANTTNKIFEL